MHARIEPASRGCVKYTAKPGTQGFYSEDSLFNLLARASEERGRFRTFLLKSFQSYTLDQIKRSRRQKHFPSGGFAPLDEALENAEVSISADQQAAFDDGFARQVIPEAIHRTRQQCLADESPEIWEILHARILAPHLEEKPPEDYLVLIRELNLKDTAEAHNKMNSGKRMFKRFFRKVIEEFAMDETELEDELLESNSRPWEQSGQQKAVG
jgi:hypothetical protein